MSPVKRRRPALGDRPSSRQDSTTANTALDGASLHLTAHWFAYVEDEFGDPYEPPEAAFISVKRTAVAERADCGCAGRYVIAA
jgi:hypothetical protein